MCDLIYLVISLGKFNGCKSTLENVTGKERSELDEEVKIKILHIKFLINEWYLDTETVSFCGEISIILTPLRMKAHLREVEINK